MAVESSITLLSCMCLAHNQAMRHVQSWPGPLHACKLCKQVVKRHGLVQQAHMAVEEPCARIVGQHVPCSHTPRQQAEPAEHEESNCKTQRSPSATITGR